MATIHKLPESTIRMIAAGEVITKPVNVVKELLENSLDAGATNVRVTIEQGGLSFIEIVDNGSGIARSDAELLCQRYATSKLNTADDLARVTSFGFRGEALASISEVAEVEVKSFNPTSDCMGWQAQYQSGQMLDQIQDKYIRVGTQIIVKNLFSKIDRRKKALEIASKDEKKAILDLMMRYAIHHRDKVTMILTDSKPPDLLCVMSPVELGPCLGSLFGIEIENNLIYFEFENKNQYEAQGTVAFSYKTNSVYNGSIFFLFINDRLVECQDLKQEVDGLIQQYLNRKENTPFTYITLKVPQDEIDVNTHPAKATVTLQNQTEIIALIITSFREKLSDNLENKSIKLNNSKAKLFTTQSFNNSQKLGGSDSELGTPRLKLLAPGSLSQPEPHQSQKSVLPSLRPFEIVHTDSKQTRLNQFFDDKKLKSKSNREIIRPWPGIDNLNYDEVKKLKTNNDETVDNASRVDLEAEKVNRIELVEINSDTSCPATVIIGDSASDTVGTCAENLNIQNDVNFSEDSNSQKQQEEIMEDIERRKPQRERRELKLFSLKLLREKVLKRRSPGFSKFIKNTEFVGIFDHKHGLIQHETGLYALNLKALFEEQCYQFYLFDLGNFPPIQILPPGNKIQFFVQTYLDDIQKHERKLYDSLEFNTPDLVVGKLLKHSAMLEDYLSITMTEDEILTIPNIIPDEIPNLIFLGEFLVKLANKVDFRDEYRSIKRIGKIIADFYSAPPANLKDFEVHKRYHDFMENKMWPAIKAYLIVPKKFEEPSLYIVKITDTKDLYKVFERC